MPEIVLHIDFMFTITCSDNQLRCICLDQVTSTKKETSCCSIIQIKRASQRKHEPPLRRPFELPTNFNASIQEGLDREHLTGKARGKFVTAIAHSLFKHKSNPTQDEYQHVAELMVKKWKFLQTKSGYVSSECLLHVSVFSGAWGHVKYVYVVCYIYG